MENRKATITQKAPFKVPLIVYKTFINNIEIVISIMPNILLKFVFSLNISDAIIADRIKLLPNFSG